MAGQTKLGHRQLLHDLCSPKKGTKGVNLACRRAKVQGSTSGCGNTLYQHLVPPGSREVL